MLSNLTQSKERQEIKTWVQWSTSPNSLFKFVVALLSNLLFFFSSTSFHAQDFIAMSFLLANAPACAALCPAYLKTSWVELGRFCMASILPCLTFACLLLWLPQLALQQLNFKYDAIFGLQWVVWCNTADCTSPHFFPLFMLIAHSVPFSANC